jgi:hypothetical protein
MRPKLLIQKRIGLFSQCSEQGVLSVSLLFICNPTKLSNTILPNQLHELQPPGVNTAGGWGANALQPAF